MTKTAKLYLKRSAQALLIAIFIGLIVAELFKISGAWSFLTGLGVGFIAQSVALRIARNERRDQLEKIVRMCGEGHPQAQNLALLWMIEDGMEGLVKVLRSARQRLARKPKQEE